MTTIFSCKETNHYVRKVNHNDARGTNKRNVKIIKQIESDTKINQVESVIKINSKIKNKLNKQSKKMLKLKVIKSVI